MNPNKKINLWVVSVLMILLGQNIAAQQYRATTEIQSTFIDITGLFGVNEPTSITQFSYIKNRFGLDLYHGFSLQNFGKTIQTIATPSYLFKFDSLSKFSIKAKVEIANLEASGGGFLRPGVHFIYKPNNRHTLNIGAWTFSDFRDKEIHPKRLNGHTFMLSYTHSKDFKKWKLIQETRVLYVDIVNTLQVGGLFQNIQFTYKPIKFYFGGNVVYSFYRSDKKNALFWNLTLGKYF
jgi:hypothetical protein